MKKLFVALLVLLAGVALALFARHDTGLLVINLRNWTIETSVTFALLVIALGFVLLYLLLRLLGGTRRVPQRWRHWRGQRRRGKAVQNLNRGLLELLQGEWGAAQRHLLSGIENAEAPALNFLAAACAAQQRGDVEQRDRYLERAFHDAPRHSTAVALVQAELQIRQGQYEQALATLTDLQQRNARNPYVLSRLQSLYIRLQDWERLLELLPRLRRQRVIDRDEVLELERQAWHGLLKAAIRSQQGEHVAALWQRIPKALRLEQALLLPYVRYLILDGRHEAAERLLADALQHDWQEGWIYLYGMLDRLDAARLLGRVEHWLKTRRNDAMLLLTAGRICHRAGIWGKAREYLEASVRERPRPESYKELAEVFEASGEGERARECYRLGLGALRPERSLEWNQERMLTGGAGGR